MGGYYSKVSVLDQGKASENSFARHFVIKTNEASLPADTNLCIYRSQFFHPDSVPVGEMPSQATKHVNLPHRVMLGHELEFEEKTVYALVVGDRVLREVPISVKMSEHASFVIDPVPGGPINFAEQFPRFFIIRNSTSVTLPAAILSILATGCFQPSSVPIEQVLPGGEKRVELPHRVNPGINLSSIEEKTTYALTVNGVIVKEMTRVASMYEYSGFLAQPRTPVDTVFQILCFGATGGGKSSFILSLFSALSPSPAILYGLARVSGQRGHCTRELGKYIPGAVLRQVVLWDTWGLSATQYQENEVARLVAGEIPEGWDMRRIAGSETDE